MSLQPKVSVVIPTYNRATLLPRAIHSVLNQTYSNLELIVVDDCSTDNTEQVVKAIKDDRLIYIKLEQNKGANFARNVGIKAANSDFIAFQDSDDEWLPEKLSRQMKSFKVLGNNVGVVYCGYIRVNEFGVQEIRPFRHITPTSGNIIKPLLYGNFITTQAVIVRKNVFDKVGFFDETLRRYQDWDMFLRIAKEYEFNFVDKPLLNTYYTTDSISADRTKLISSLRLVIEKHNDLFLKYPIIRIKHGMTLWLGNYMHHINIVLSKYPKLKSLIRKMLS